MQTVEGHKLRGKQLVIVEPGETPTLAARPSFATVSGGSHWKLPLLLLTDRRFVISREKLIGRPKADFAAEWSEVSGVAGKLWNGAGPLIQLLVQAKGASIELLMQPAHATDVESAIRAGCLQ
jgi:hypothetical protein